MEFILLMDRIKCCYNTTLQILTNSPVLHSLIIRECEDVADILKFLCHIHGGLRKLILKDCWLGKDSTGLLYPDLEVLSLELCYPLTSAGYCLIPHLKKLSELNLSEFDSDYVSVLNHWRRMFVYVNARRRTPLEIRFIY